jgi:hypothetical protein
MKSSRISRPAAASAQTQPKTQTNKPARGKRRSRNKELPLMPPPVVSRKGKTTVSRYSNRTFYRMEEAKGKTLDFVEFFTTNGYHAIEIGFDDKTALNLLIEPCFTLEREYADWKTGNWRPLKQWPVIRSQR